MKVLTLGWEFPPIINGGLGVACYGLTKSLSKLAEINLILPKTDANTFLENVNLIGLNQLDVNQLKKTGEDFSYESFTAKIKNVDIDFSPYTDNLEDIDSEIRVKTNKPVEYLDDISAFEIDDLYGWDIMDKIRKYARLSVRLASEMDFDVIHAHDWMTFIAGCELKSVYNKPLILHVHALETDRTTTDNRGEVYHIEKASMEYADKVIAVSNYTKSQIVSYYGLSPQKISVVHNGIEYVNKYHTPKPFKEKIVLFLGRLTGQKGPGYFVEVAHRVIQQNPDVRFVMAGTGDRLKNLIETGAYKELGTKFHFTGFLNREKVHQLLSMADVYVMPSVSEPFGLSALEAAQFGVPCVLSYQSGVSEVLSGALKADFWDVGLMAKHINTLLENELVREQVVSQ
ncbi:MAG: glycosyltransferase, partial [Cytophagales bacterium]